MCKKHPKYKAVKCPRVDCDACWRMYVANHGKDKALDAYFRIFRGGLDKRK